MSRPVERITPEGRAYVDGEPYQLVVAQSGALGLVKLEQEGVIDQAGGQQRDRDPFGLSRLDQVGPQPKLPG